MQSFSQLNWVFKSSMNCSPHALTNTKYQIFVRSSYFLQNTARKCCVHKLFWMSKTISVPNMLSPCSELGIFMYWTLNSMSSYCGLVDVKIRASDKDLPVRPSTFLNVWESNGSTAWLQNKYLISTWGDKKTKETLLFKDQ